MQQQVACTGTPPAPRSGHAAATDGDTWYVYGGLGARRYGDLHMCSFSDNFKWSLVDVKGDVPPPRCKASLVQWKGKLFLFGGWGTGHRNSGESKMNDLWCMTIGEWVWSRVSAKGGSPPPRSSHSCVVVGNKMYLFGGIGAQKFNDLWCFDFTTREWQPLHASPAPGKRSSYGQLHYHAGGLLVVGGLGCGQFNDCWRCDLETTPLSWKQIACTGDAPSKRGRHATCIIGNELLLVGGTNLRVSHSDIYSLDLCSLKWTKHAVRKQFTPRDSSVACAVDGKMLLHGGCNQARTWYSDMWMVSPSTCPPPPADDPFESIPSEVFTSDTPVSDDELVDEDEE